MYNSQYYTCEQIDERLLQGYLDDYNSQTGQSLTKAQFLTKLGSLFSKEGTIDNTLTQIGYYECDTAAGTAAKVITVANYSLFAGGSMKVKFVNKNTANNATLNINSQGAKALYYQGERASSTNSWDEGEVVEIYYDGTSYYANNVKGGSGSGVYDVSKEHPTSGPNSDGKFTLDYILNPSNVNELIPVNKRFGGMSIMFVQSSDNKYVQARCMAQNFTTNVANWQGVDDGIHPDSQMLAKSGDVFCELYNSLYSPIQFEGSPISNSYIIIETGNIGSSNSYHINYYSCRKGDKFKLSYTSFSGIVSAAYGIYSTDNPEDIGQSTNLFVSSVGEVTEYNIEINSDSAKTLAVTVYGSDSNMSLSKLTYENKISGIEDNVFYSMVASRDWRISGNVVYDSNEIPLSYDITWADGTIGTVVMSNFNSDVFEYTTITATYKEKTFIYTLTYDSNGYIINESYVEQ